jgi:NADH dehydrogenase FAD-containing subunit
VNPDIAPVKVLIAGAGYGGLETALALKDGLAERVEITLLTATVDLTYRPLSSGAPFVREPARRIDVHRLAAERGMRVVLDELVTVQEDECRVLTHDGELIDFDALVIAVGAHERGSAPPLITWGQEPDQGQLGALLVELAAGTVKAVAVTIPAGACWPLAGNEAALIVAWTASHLAPTPVSVTLITAEERPASGLGPKAADWVGRILADAGVEVLSSSVVHNFTAEQDTHDRGGGHTVRVTLGDPDQEITVDRVLCVPESFGPEVSGLPSTPHGFLPTGVDGRVLDSDRVWAFGDAARRALKHSIITAAEADSVASSIIATLGLGEPSGAPLPALHGILVDAPEQRWWDANRGHLHDEQMASGCLWWPPEEALGAHLARWAHTHDHAVHTEIHWHPNGLPVIVAAPASDPTIERLTPAVHPQSKDLLHDSQGRERMAIRRTEHQMAATAHELGEGLQALDKRQHTVIEQLRAAGYLQHHQHTAGG